MGNSIDIIGEEVPKEQVDALFFGALIPVCKHLEKYALNIFKNSIRNPSGIYVYKDTIVGETFSLPVRLYNHPGEFYGPYTAFVTSPYETADVIIDNIIFGPRRALLFAGDKLMAGHVSKRQGKIPQYITIFRETKPITVSKNELGHLGSLIEGEINQYQPSQS